jgi:flagellar motility protein MotE (MotC chaperone)
MGPDTLTESERKKMVQIFESMEPENAARILLNMSDAAVKQVLTTMKKRQSAKILAVLEPAQAARILKEKL